MFRVRRCSKPPLGFAHQPCLLHDASNASPTRVIALFCQYCFKTARSIDGTVLNEGGGNHCFQFLIALGFATFSRCRPRIVRATAHREHRTQ
ncbi:MAG: hypothetical protein QX190_02315 [Methylococcales bacterium]